MRNSIVNSIQNTIRDLNKSGVVDDITLRNIEKLCIPDIQEYTPQKITSLRKRFGLSQAALASVFNISTSTVQKWEQGNKKPAGASKKLLSIVEKKGLDPLL